MQLRILLAGTLLLSLAASSTQARHRTHGDSVRAAAHLPGRITLHEDDSSGNGRLKRPATDPAGEKIPRILHYIFLSGFDEFVKQTEVPRARMKKAYYDSCLAVHQHWEIKFWTQQMAEDLIKTHYVWFLPVWETYDMEVKRADAIRPFILHHYGGVYLDLDNQCYEPIEKLYKSFEPTDKDRVVKQHDLILQGSGWEGLNNGMMASAPRHPIWMKLADVLKERHGGSETEPVKNLPLYMTGPSVLAATVQRYLNLPGPTSGFINKMYEIDGTVVKIYCLGEFFMPCWGADLVCQKQLANGLSAGSWDTTNIVGRHWFASTWNRPELLFPEKFKNAAPVVPAEIVVEAEPHVDGMARIWKPTR